jgi:hypothetical protein
MALKILKPEIAADKDMIERFKHEPRFKELLKKYGVVE